MVGGIKRVVLAAEKMGKLGLRLSALRSVFSNEKYLYAAVILSVLFYILNISISQFAGLVYTADIFDVIKLYTLGAYQVLGAVSLVSTLILSVLTGILLSVLLFRADMARMGIKKKLSPLDYLGVFFGIMVPGCPECGLGLIAIFGFGASVASLPFGGAEISIIAIAIILFSLWHVTPRLLTCKIGGPVCANADKCKEKKV